MKKTFVLIFFSLIMLRVNGQAKINLPLKRELDSIYVLDQKYRELLSFSNQPAKKDSLAKVFGVSVEDLHGVIWQKQEKIDISNQKRVEEIIKQYGYPGKTLVGTPTNTTVFYVIQHSSKIKDYIELIEKAARKDELPFNRYAMMLDRLLMQEGKEQIYGTQVFMFGATNPETNKLENHKIVWSIKDPQNVNALRKEAGIKDSIEEYAKRLDITYKIVTLAEYNQLIGKE